MVEGLGGLRGRDRGDWNRMGIPGGSEGWVEQPFTNVSTSSHPEQFHLVPGLFHYPRRKPHIHWQSLFVFPKPPVPAKMNSLSVSMDLRVLGHFV